MQHQLRIRHARPGLAAWYKLAAGRELAAGYQFDRFCELSEGCVMLGAGLGEKAEVGRGFFWHVVLLVLYF